MDAQLKRKMMFTLSMGIVTTGIITFTLLAMNLGFLDGFILKWLRSWFIAYLIFVPVLLFLGPRLQAQIDRIVA
jgi:hypothetical protein